MHKLRDIPTSGLELAFLGLIQPTLLHYDNSNRSFILVSNNLAIDHVNKVSLIINNCFISLL